MADQGGGLSIMEEMFEYFTAEIDSIERLLKEGHTYFPGSQHRSVITFHGRPILPPLMTAQRYAESAVHRQQAVQVEAELHARARQTLLQRIHTVMSEIEVKYSRPPKIPLLVKNLGEKFESDSDNSIEQLVTAVQAKDHLNLDLDCQGINQVQKDDQHGKPSPRTVTKDSGVYLSKEVMMPPTVSEPHTHESYMDTMADITDLSDDEHTTAISYEESVVQCNLTYPTDPTVPAGHPHFDKNFEDNKESYSTFDAYGQKLDYAMKCTGPIEDKDNLLNSSSTPVDLDNKEQQERHHASLNALGSCAQVGMSAFRQPVAVIASVRSTSSSGTTVSSEEMSRTVIGREEAELCLAAAKVLDDTTSTITDADTIKDSQAEQSTSSDEQSSDVKHASPELVELEFYPAETLITVGSQTEAPLAPCYSGETNTPLLLKTDLFDTPELTSESDQDCRVLHCDNTSESETESRLKAQDAQYSESSSAVMTEHENCSFNNVLSKYSGHCAESSDTNDNSPSSKRESSSLPSSAPASPGPMSTPNVSAIADDYINRPVTAVSAHNYTDTIIVKQNPSILSDPFIMSQDTSQLYTASTELGPYMATSVENSLPISSLATLPSITDKEDYHNTKNEETVPVISNRARKDSYTLEQPSPALVLPVAETRSDLPDKQNISISKSKGDILLTSSMEDLQLKSVQRKLDYAEVKQFSQAGPQPIISDLKPITSPSFTIDKQAEKRGKEQHLQKYLSDLSQMPVYQTSKSRITVNTEKEYIVESLPEKETWKSLDKPITPYNVLAHETTNILKLDNSHSINPTVPDVVMGQEDLLQLQAQYFESLQKQLMQQQQAQLHMMLAEQQQQQILLQQELLHMAHSLDSRPVSVQTAPSNNSTEDQNISGRLHQYEHNYSHQPSSAPSIPNSLDASISHHSIPNLNKPQKTNPGVFCKQEFPVISPVKCPVDQQPSASEGNENSFGSPAVLRYRPPVNESDSLMIQKEDPQTLNYANSLVIEQSEPEYADEEVKRPYTAPLPRTKHVSFSSHQVTQTSHHKFCRISAAVKGYLTRRLMCTERVLSVIQTIKDTLLLAIKFQQETPIKKGQYSNQDRSFQFRIINQLNAAMYDFHEIFFETSIKDQMQMIQQNRVKEKERIFKQQSFIQNQNPIKVSAATKKAIERRRKAQLAEANVFGNVRPKSAPPSNSPRSSKTTDFSGAIKKNFKFLIGRAVRPKLAAHSPIKPEKDNMNRVVAQERNLLGMKRIQNTKTKGTVSKGKVVKKTSANPVVRKVARPVAAKSTKSADKTVTPPSDKRST